MALSSPNIPLLPQSSAEDPQLFVLPSIPIITALSHIHRGKLLNHFPRFQPRTALTFPQQLTSSDQEMIPRSKQFPIIVELEHRYLANSPAEATERN